VKLNGKLNAKKNALGAAKDQDEKDTIQKDIDQLTKDIADKKAQIREMTVAVKPPKQFPKRADADKYVEQVYKDAEAAKERKKEADAKKATG
jgi:hypothetical protein